MDLNEIESDEDVVKYLAATIAKISPLKEHRLFKEEQLQISEEVMSYRNCIEWIIRANGIIHNIKYALIQSLSYAQKMQSPLEETENKVMYSYYLEDAVYRDIVLWDIYRQLLNEYYKCGYSENEEISIFAFLKAKKNTIDPTKADPILKYLKSKKHQKVRKDLRNSFTHSVEATSPYIFHRTIDGKMQPEIERIFPDHPYNNINVVVDDVLVLISFIENTTCEIKKDLLTKIALYCVSITLPCGKVEKDHDLWNLYLLNEHAERIFISCSTPCSSAHTYKGQYVCKPVNICYYRIHSQPGEYDGTITLIMTFSDVEKICQEEELSLT